MHNDELKDLLERATTGAPGEDLTEAAWRDGRRRARRHSWSVGSLGAVAGVAAVVAAWSLGGGSTDASPGPAESGGVDDTAVTSIPPGAEMVPYRVVFEVVEGEPRPDGPVDSWADVEEVVASPTEFVVEGPRGIISTDWASPLRLGGPINFTEPETMTLEVDCFTMVFEDVTFTEKGRIASPEIGRPAVDSCLGYNGVTPVTALATDPEASLSWAGGKLELTGHEDLLSLDDASEELEESVLLANVPPTELTALQGASLEPGGPPDIERVIGEWWVVDTRWLEPQGDAARMRFDGERLTITACGRALSAPAVLVGTQLRIEDDWESPTGSHAAAATAGQPGCPSSAWQNLHQLQEWVTGDRELWLEETDEEELLLTLNR
ncbi:hypothetical protein [Serinicoccus marinus]|uniref:hypothetical protein n=1 Tax=Serinicoccus marinus TaxID=247333 RepID=UPI0003B57B7C|nr:hypothetical protein [Serinicoccus marinus]